MRRALALLGVEAMGIGHDRSDIRLLGVSGMMRKSCLLLMMALSLVVPDFSRTPNNCEEIFNPKGWKLPNKELFELIGIEKLSLPGVPYEITAEQWRPKKISEKLSTNLPLYQETEMSSVGPIIGDEVLFLTVYKTRDGRVICYRCDRVLQFAPELYGNAVVSYACDLDGDGSYESQFPCESDSEEAQLLASIARIRLGQSEEDWLVNKMVQSILCQLKKNGR